MGAPTFRVRNKIFAMFAPANDHHGAGRMPSGSRPRPVTKRRWWPPRPSLLRAPYVGPKGWIGIWLDGVVEWNDIAEFHPDSMPRRTQTAVCLAGCRRAPGSIAHRPAAAAFIQLSQAHGAARPEPAP